MSDETKPQTAEAAAVKPTFTLEQCQEHTEEESCWLIIHGNVYDVTEFLEEHPGGFDVITSSAGRDATQDFEEVGHSKKAREMLEQYLIGTLEGGVPEQKSVPAPRQSSTAPENKGMNSFARIFLVLLPVLFIIIAVAINGMGSKA